MPDHESDFTGPEYDTPREARVASQEADADHRREALDERLQGQIDDLRQQLEAETQRRMAAELAHETDTGQLQAENDRLRKALEAHHKWHLEQTDRTPVYFGDIIGQINAEEYGDSELCEVTVRALSPEPAPGSGETV